MPSKTPKTRCLIKPSPFVQSLDWQTWLADYWLIGLCASAQLITFILYWRDKRLAINDKSRIPEATLLWWTLIGGLGAAGGVWIVRHKSKKWSYLWKAMLLMLVSTASWAIAFMGPTTAINFVQRFLQA